MSKLYLPVIIFSICCFFVHGTAGIPLNNGDYSYRMGQFLEKDKKYARALHYYQESYEAYIREKAVKKAAESRYRMGKIYRLLTNVDQSGRMFLEAISRYSEIADTMGLINSYMQLGLLYGDHGNADKALFYYQHCLDLSTQMRDVLFLATVLSNIAGIYGDYIDPKKGLEYNLRALNLLDKTNSVWQARNNTSYKTVRSYLLNNIGMYYMNTSDTGSAFSCFRKSLELKKEICDYKGMVFTYGNMGQIFLDRKIESKARQNFTLALILADSIHNPLCLSLAYHSMGELYFNEGNSAKAIPCLLKSLHFSNLSGYQDQKKENLLALSQSYEHQGRLKEAFEYYRAYDILKDSIFKVASQKSIAEMNTRYETAVREQKIQKLQTEGVMKGAKIRQSELLILLLSTIIFVVLVIVIFLVRNYRVKIENLHHLVQQDLELRQSERLNEPEVKEADETAPEKDFRLGPPDEVRIKLTARLINLIVQQRRFLDTELTLSEVAKELESNTAYLSRIINEDFAANFNQFINTHRIREARRMLVDPDFFHLSIEGIARSSGFNSKSVFNSVFKKITGVTPSFYQRSAMEIMVTEQPPENHPDQATWREISS